MSILVVGGAGYVGSHAVDRLVAEGYDVVVVDNLLTGHRQSVHQAARFYQGDIRDRAFLAHVFTTEKIDSVMHFAASSLVGESVQKPLLYFNNNIYGMQVLLEVMVEHDVKYIVFSSSAATYGEPKKVPITESAPTEPTSPYGECKLMMEKMIKWCDLAYGIKYTALRYFNVAGAKLDGSIGEDHRPETHIIPITLQVALGQRDKLIVFGDDYDTPDGTCIRDYVHIEDLISAHILSLEYMKAHNCSHIFNLGSNYGYSVKEILEAAREITGLPIPAEIGPRRAGDPSKLVAASDQIKTVLGWQPVHEDVKEMIQSAWSWHRQHPNGYEE